MATTAFVGGGANKRLWHKHGGQWHWVEDNHPMREHAEHDAAHPIWVLPDRVTATDIDWETVKRYTKELAPGVGKMKRLNSNGTVPAFRSESVTEREDTGEDPETISSLYKLKRI